MATETAFNIFYVADYEKSGSLEDTTWLFTIWKQSERDHVIVTPHPHGTRIKRLLIPISRNRGNGQRIWSAQWYIFTPHLTTQKQYAHNNRLFRYPVRFLHIKPFFLISHFNCSHVWSLLSLLARLSLFTFSSRESWVLCSLSFWWKKKISYWFFEIWSQVWGFHAMLLFIYFFWCYWLNNLFIFYVQGRSRSESTVIDLKISWYLMIIFRCDRVRIWS